MRFDSTLLPERERLSHLEGTASAFATNLPPGAKAASFFAQLDAWALGDLVIINGRMSAVRITRTAEMAQSDGLDSYSFGLMQTGETVGTANGMPVRARPGDLVVFDLTLPMQIDVEASDSITIRVPRRSVDARLSRTPNIHGRVFSDPVGRLLTDHFLALVRQLSFIAQQDAHVVANATIGLIACCFEAQPALTAALLDGSTQRGNNVAGRIRHYINQNLRSPNLSTTTICRELGLSRGVVYRTFAVHRGIATYIRVRRLEKIHALLLNSLEQRNISAIADEFGFPSYAHFSKAFRHRYGYGPRELRIQKAGIFRRLAESRAEHQPVDTYLSWVNPQQP